MLGTSILACQASAPNRWENNGLPIHSAYSGLTNLIYYKCSQIWCPSCTNMYPPPQNNPPQQKKPLKKQHDTFMKSYHVHTMPDTVHQAATCPPRQRQYPSSPKGLRGKNTQTYLMNAPYIRDLYTCVEEIFYFSVYKANVRNVWMGYHFFKWISFPSTHSHV